MSCAGLTLRPRLTNQEVVGVAKKLQGVSVEKAAAGLGISKWGAYRAIERGDLKVLPGRGPTRVSEAEVERFRRARHAAAVERLKARGADVVELARATRSFLQPHPGDGKRTVSMLGPDVVAVFGAPAVHAASLPAPTCGWCASVVAAQLMHTDPPPYGKAMLALLGPPCPRDMQRFAAAEMEALAARVHPGGVRPSGGRAAASGSSRPAASPVPRPWPAQPVQDDNGRALVAARLRVARARLKDAKRRNDQAYAIKLRAIVASLEADAAAVDGRAPSAAARPGRLACGHLLADRCSCPRKGSRPVAASGGAARRRPHPCGCDCPEHRGQS